ncbi:hypothetical protein OHAE_4921 [Ochrobactrum soli]|uniref:Uncharacterized protein n=1 Tax=Ochrobactrum soli TaxID=2448455 RepID=A0A2P9HDF8_9HYPH|nr:hypothetical protein OHAE_4921 [[Ochrobactrum] soli]
MAWAWHAAASLLGSSRNFITCSVKDHRLDNGVSSVEP